ncbi:tyrosine-type recombinase/integrase [Lactobacillus gasseri]|uniref:Toxin-antitoxin system, toxin component, PIN family n=1 Tax=Lactobacillus gasseri SV-16A-US TaxID=575604 RepID=A0AB34P2M8_LACGS|nr:site-specific integrase [Lactobacillus gasseri]KFL98203.1 toxin-antitoxin system, toxin component, PIN family [Lactobacillus gasseri SV-16A-US]MCZ3947920.1 site-specific integrase [Lactobacillus gasseri]QTH66832.1 tyrosine-type recombinase/integrase [Lactobacillus gasseri]
MNIKSKNIKEYLTASGKKRFKFIAYLGQDESTGKPIQVRKQGYKSYEDAKKDLLKLKNQISTGTYAPREKRFKFKKVYDDWKNIYIDTVKESTYATTERIMKQHVLPELGELYIDTIKIINCQEAVNKWFKEAPKSYRKYIRYANQVFNYAIRLELIETNPMEKVFRPKVREERESTKLFYEKNELLKYLRFAKEFRQEAYTLFYTFAYTGLRCGEAIGLEWKDINLQKRTLTVDRTVSTGINNRKILQTPKTYNSSRKITLTPETVKVLENWKREQQRALKIINLNNNQFVFNGFVNNMFANVPLSTTTIDRWNCTIAKKAGLEHIKVHGFRHTHASLLFASGASMQDVKERLGHASITTTMNVYTHLTNQQKEQTIADFSSYMES